MSRYAPTPEVMAIGRQCYTCDLVEIYSTTQWASGCDGYRSAFRDRLLVPPDRGQG